MELHDENPFKIRSYQSALISLERGDQDIMVLSEQELAAIQGVGKSMLEAIQQLKETDTFPMLEELLAKTPEGILEVLQIKGLGPKKIKTLWTELGITSTHELMEACQSGKVAKIKGFGEKTQNTIIENLEFTASNSGKWLYADIAPMISQLEETLRVYMSEATLDIVGDFARRLEIITEAEFLIAGDELAPVKSNIRSMESIEWNLRESGPRVLRGNLKDIDLKISVHFCAKEDYLWKKLSLIAAPLHLESLVDEQESVAKKLFKKDYASEEEFFSINKLQFIPVEMREGFGEIEMAKENKIPDLLTEKDLKGIIHNHSTYSDGKHSLRQMAEYCRELGYGYLGISDHSKTAFYAGGLTEDQINKQHQEIDALNKEMSPFRIFKGIESDILSDGKLDYAPEVLASFDFIVSSVHSILNMDIRRATARLITAIENPYTTILGHPTGRLLLRRQGYPIDHRAIVDACAANNVVIEINANPWRLDLDWRWVRYAMDQGVMLSINPDAHAMEGYSDMKYGVLVGRKGGLTAEMTLNAMNVDEISRYFNSRLEKIKSKK
ncbi:helix-hairpin-helix domain-containing protein [Algoriphagus sp. AGSA1]|nr:helix-hairpin-helix domain-containing protein [Algoriphagus sp. AGSA1]